MVLFARAAARTVRQLVRTQILPQNLKGLPRTVGKQTYAPHTRFVESFFAMLLQRTVSSAFAEWLISSSIFPPPLVRMMATLRWTQGAILIPRRAECKCNARASDFERFRTQRKIWNVTASCTLHCTRTYYSYFFACPHAILSRVWERQR